MLFSRNLTDQITFLKDFLSFNNRKAFLVQMHDRLSGSPIKFAIEINPLPAIIFN